MTELPQGVSIRHYKGRDRETVRRIACDTAFFGESSRSFFDGSETLSDFLTGYFTDYEPESCFVAEIGGKVIGYLLGTRDSIVLSRVFSQKILPRLLSGAVLGGVFFKKRNLSFLLRLFISLLRREFKMPDFSVDYPAVLHINLDKDYRNLNIGSRLIAIFMDYLARNKVSGVRLATMSDKSAVFFKKQGFNLLYQARRTYFRNLLGKDISVYIYGKIVDNRNYSVI